MQALGVRERFDAELKKALKAKKKMAKSSKTAADWQRELEGKQNRKNSGFLDTPGTSTDTHDYFAETRLAL